MGRRSVKFTLKKATKVKLPADVFSYRRYRYIRIWAYVEYIFFPSGGYEPIYFAKESTLIKELKNHACGAIYKVVRNPDNTIDWKHLVRMKFDLYRHDMSYNFTETKEYLEIVEALDNESN